MTDPEQPDNQESIPPEEQLQTSLLRLRGRLGEIDQKLLTPRQFGLITDCIGLLHAMSNGQECKERTIIRDRLIETLALFGGPDTTIGELSPEKQKLIAGIALTLEHASTLGIALEEGGRPRGHSGRPRT